MRHRTHRGAAALLGLVVCAITAPAASAAWQAPLPIADRGTWPGDPAPALGPRGEALAVWSSGTDRRGYRVHAKVRHGLRAAWLGPALLSPRLERRPSTPAVATNGRGDAVVMWRVAGGPVRSAVRSGRRGRWRPFGVPSGGGDAGDPNAGFASARVRVAVDGSAVAVWTARRGGRWIVEGARRGSSGPWRRTPGFALGTDVDATRGPLLGLGATGDAAALWLGPGPVADARPVRAARRLGTGLWGPTVSLAEAASDVDLGVAADGRAIAAWGTAVVAAPGPQAAAAQAAPGSGTWGPSEALPATGAPRVAINARGDLLSAWTEPAGDGHALRAAFRPSGAPWGPSATVGASLTLQAGALRDETVGVDEPAPVTLDEAGAGRIAWIDTGDFARTASGFVATGRAAGWGAPVAISTGGPSATLALAPGPARTALLLARPDREDVAILAMSDDPAPPVRVAATARGRWDARRYAVRWTIRVRNTGRISAHAVQLRISVCCGSRLLAGRPAATIEGRNAVWRLGSLAPRRARTVTALIRSPGTPLAETVWLGVSVKATAMPVSSSQWRTVVPRSWGPRVSAPRAPGNERAG